jgi:hypothetical protein
MINHSNEGIEMDDANSPELNRVILGRVSTDFIKVSDNLKEASYQIRKRGFSVNPIFVVSQTSVPMGQLLYGRDEFENIFDYKASMLEEFVQRNLVSEESVEHFKENYKNPDEFCCLFVMEGDFAGFIYMPFPED